jgi:hypothetical protein
MWGKYPLFEQQPKKKPKKQCFIKKIATPAYHLPQLKEFFSFTMFEIFSSVLAYRIFDLLLVVVFFHYVIYCCQYHEPLC